MRKAAQLDHPGIIRIQVEKVGSWPLARIWRPQRDSGRYGGADWRLHWTASLSGWLWSARRRWACGSIRTRLVAANLARKFDGGWSFASRMLHETVVVEAQEAGRFDAHCAVCLQVIRGDSADARVRVGELHVVAGDYIAALAVKHWHELARPEDAKRAEEWLAGMG